MPLHEQSLMCNTDARLRQDGPIHIISVDMPLRKWKQNKTFVVYSLFFLFSFFLFYFFSVVFLFLFLLRFRFIRVAVPILLLFIWFHVIEKYIFVSFHRHFVIWMEDRMRAGGIWVGWQVGERVLVCVCVCLYEVCVWGRVCVRRGALRQNRNAFRVCR